MKIKILGSGASYGVPSISGNFGECDPNNPKNIRTRSACLLEEAGSTFLLDCGPEIRMQLLRAECRRLDGVFFSHVHYDHIGGTDDLRGLAYETGEKIPAYIAAENVAYFSYLYNYLISPERSIRPPLELKTIQHYKPFQLNGIEITPILQYHGNHISTGYRFNDLAYSTDVKSMDEAGFNALKGIKIWILGIADRYENNKHVHLEQAFQWIERINPERVYVTHMGNTLDYETLKKELPDFIRPCYDGMEINV